MRGLHRLRLLTTLSLFVLLLLVTPVCTSLGTYKISLIDVLRVLVKPDSSELSRVVWQLRMPRVVAAILVGAVLGSSGAAVQAVMRNPLASPFTFGLMHAAALGVAIALLALHGGTVERFQIYVSNPYLLSVSAFIFSVVQVFILLALALRAGLSANALVLSAIATSFAYQAVLYLLEYLYLNELMVSTVVFWTFGDLSRVTWAELQILAAGAGLLVLPYFLLRRFDYDLILSGEDVAKSSGVHPGRVRLETTLVAALGTALATSFVGVIGFVCLVAPHIARLLVGGGHRYLVPASIAVGALILLLADTLGRTVIAPTVIPAGVMTSIIGVPVLVYLLLKGGIRGRGD
ncbi:MAG: iron ABC transporter permease [Infirmifilum sp.]